MTGAVLICGSRDWSRYGAILNRVEQLPINVVVIHGGADGADKMAGKAAADLGHHVAVVRPLWDLHGGSAGHKRNAAMLDLKPSLVIAFTNGSNGTQGTIDEARRRGIPVEVHGTEAA